MTISCKHADDRVGLSDDGAHAVNWPLIKRSFLLRILKWRKKYSPSHMDFTWNVTNCGKLRDRNAIFHWPTTAKGENRAHLNNEITVAQLASRRSGPTSPNKCFGFYLPFSLSFFFFFIIFWKIWPISVKRWKWYGSAPIALESCLSSLLLLLLLLLLLIFVLATQVSSMQLLFNSI